MLGLPKGQVFLVPWTEQWEIEFKEEERKIRSEINDSILATHHIGSTAIQGLSAKPIIDIAIEIKLFEEEIHCVRYSDGATDDVYAYSQIECTCE